MAATEDRANWIIHVHDCTQCGTATCLADLCDVGALLASDVRASMAPGETWKLSR